MIDTRVELLEKEFVQLKTKYATLHTDVRELQEVLNEVWQASTFPPRTETDLSDDKVKYLTEVNEQMFKQNRRLRALIEHCVEAQTIPTHQEYSRALQG